MQNTRSGTIKTIEMIVDQGDALVHRFTLDTNPEEELTVCMPNSIASETPVLHQSVLVFLHPADSKWPKHAVQVVGDVPQRVVNNLQNS